MAGCGREGQRMFVRRPTADEVLEGADLRGRVILVTGADSGIGWETARALAARGARVWLAGIRTDGLEAAAGRIVAAHPLADVKTVAFDLGSLQAVRSAVAELPEPHWDTIICNAGVYGGPYMRTVDGFERTVGVCLIGHAALVLGLADRMRAGGRVVMVSSDNHRWPTTLDFDSLPLPEAKYSELAAYGQAKLCVVMFAKAFDRRYASKGIRAYSLHPGNLVSTGIDKDSGMLKLVMTLARPFAPTPNQAAATSVWLATSDAVAALGGRYFVDRKEVAPSPAAEIEDDQDRLWELILGWVQAGAR